MEDMGMTDKQFAAFLRFVIGDLKKLQEQIEAAETEQAKKELEAKERTKKGSRADLPPPCNIPDIRQGEGWCSVSRKRRWADLRRTRARGSSMCGCQRRSLRF